MSSSRKPATLRTPAKNPKGASDDGRLTTDESAVLRIFEQYLLAPGQLFCFSRADVFTFEVALVGLLRRGLLVAERYRGAYSLTQLGFSEMKRLPVRAK